MLALLNAIPTEGRPGIFGTVSAEPLVRFSRREVRQVEGFPFFPNVSYPSCIRSAGEFDDNTSEAEIRDLCLKMLVPFLLIPSPKRNVFGNQKRTDAEVSKFDGNASLPSINFSELSQKAGTLRMGRTDDGGYLPL